MAKVLLIEDDNNLREIFEMRLQAEGYSTVTAADGEEGITVALKEKPELIISDVMMPKLSGFEMLENLRAAPEMKNTKVIMMTALGQAEDRQRGEKLGVVKYLVKSQVTLEDFAREVRGVLDPGQSQSGTSSESESSTTNKKESENSMPEDTNPTNPTQPTDGGMGAANPISGGSDPSAGAVDGSGQMSSSQEQSAVQNQINDFANSAPAGDPVMGTPAPADASAPASDAPAMDSAPAAPSGDSTAPGAAMPSAGDSPADSTPAGSTDAPDVPPATPPAETPPQPPTGTPSDPTSNAI